MLPLPSIILSKGRLWLGPRGKKIDGIMASDQRYCPSGAGPTARAYDVRVVSMPSLDLSLNKAPRIKRSVAERNQGPRAAEMSEGAHWHRFIGSEGPLNINRFGASAPGKQVIAAYGFTAAHVVEEFIRVINKKARRFLAFSNQLMFEVIVWTMWFRSSSPTLFQ